MPSFWGAGGARWTLEEEEEEEGGGRGRRRRRRGRRGSEALAALLLDAADARSCHAAGRASGRAGRGWLAAFSEKEDEEDADEDEDEEEEREGDGGGSEATANGLRLHARRAGKKVNRPGRRHGGKKILLPLAVLRPRRPRHEGAAAAHVAQLAIDEEHSVALHLPTISGGGGGGGGGSPAGGARVPLLALGALAMAPQTQPLPAVLSPRERQESARSRLDHYRSLLRQPMPPPPPPIQSRLVSCSVVLSPRPPPPELPRGLPSPRPELPRGQRLVVSIPSPRPALLLAASPNPLGPSTCLGAAPIRVDLTPRGPLDVVEGKGEKAKGGVGEEVRGTSPASALADQMWGLAAPLPPLPHAMGHFRIEPW